MNKEQTIRQKHLGVPLEKEIKKAGDGSILVRGYFTSDNIDQVGDLITKEATVAALAAYRQFGNVRLMHQPIPVGKVIRAGEEDGLAWNEVEIKVIDKQAISMVETGLLVALSVGIYFDLSDVTQRSDGTLVINRYLLAEISLVDHPANYDALLQVKTADALRSLVADRGLADVAKSMTTLLEELSMEKEAEVTQVETEEVLEETPMEVKETPVEDLLEESPNVDSEEEEIEEPEAEQEDPLEAFQKATGEFLAALEERMNVLSGLLERLEALTNAEPEGEAEVESVVEPEAEEDVQPVDRKAAVGEQLESDFQEAEKAVESLHSALRKYFNFNEVK